MALRHADRGGARCRPRRRFWRVWTSGNDIYLASLSLINTIKASPHQSGKWRVAYTQEHMTGPNPLWDDDRDRALWKFSSPPFVDGVQNAFVIAAWRNALRPCDSSADDTVVVLEDRWDVLTGVKLVVTSPGHATPRPDALVYRRLPVLAEEGPRCPTDDQRCRGCPRGATRCAVRPRAVAPRTGMLRVRQAPRSFRRPPAHP